MTTDSLKAVEICAVLVWMHKGRETAHLALVHDGVKKKTVYIIGNEASPPNGDWQGPKVDMKYNIGMEFFLVDLQHQGFLPGNSEHHVSPNGKYVFRQIPECPGTYATVNDKYAVAASELFPEAGIETMTNKKGEKVLATVVYGTNVNDLDRRI